MNHETMANRAGGEKKLPLFVLAYEILYKRICEGVYAPGEKLPSENELAADLGMSRSTLRQGMLLLQEDGLIRNSHGKGSFVLRPADPMKSGVERMCNPMVTNCATPISHVETKLNFQIATEKHRTKFNLSATSLLAMAEFCYHSEDCPVGLAQVFISYDLLAENNVELEKENAVYEFYNSFLEQEQVSAEGSMRIAYARESTSEILNIPKDSAMLMLEETVLHKARVVMLQKLFFHPEYYELKLLRRQDRFPSMP